MQKRVGLVDEIRGIAFICMVIYHAYFDIAFVYMIDLPDIVDLVMKWFQPLIAGTFITVAGISSNYSSNNFKRGVLYFFTAMLLTFVTSYVMPSETIVFGVLHFLGIAAMIYGFVGDFAECIPPVIGILVFGALYALTINVPNGYIGADWAFRADIPRFMYSSDQAFALGFPSGNFFSGDYFPLIPNLFLFMAGASLGNYIKTGRAPERVYETHSGFLTAVGKHGLLLYLLHQPVTIAVLEIIFALTGGRTLFL